MGHGSADKVFVVQVPGSEFRSAAPVQEAGYSDSLVISAHERQRQEDPGAHWPASLVN